MTIVDEMRSAGFDDATIGSWANDQKPAMKQAGFDDNTIEGYFSGLKNPGTIPRPFLSRVRSSLDSASLSDAAAEGAKAGFGEEPLGPKPETTEALRRIGVYNDYAAPGGPIGGPVKYLRMANETVIPAAITAGEGMLRGLNAALMGGGAMIGQGVSEAFGQNEADQARARRDWAHMVTIGAMLTGTVAPVTKAPIKTGQLPNDNIIGGLPQAEDFTAAAKIVQNEHAKATGGETPDAVSPEVRAKVITLWEDDHGIHPAEVSQDAQTNPEIVRSIMSSDPTELPEAYGYTKPERTTTLSEEHQAVERRLGDKISSDYPAARAEYEALPDAQGGKVLNTDTARELSPDYAASNDARSTFAQAVHEPASALTKRLYADKLKELEPGSSVMFTAGGTGAGKSSAIKSLPAVQQVADQAGIIYDTNMNSFGSASQKVNQALAAGAKVDIVMVQRDPIVAMTHGSLPRAMRMGRTVHLEAHAATHRGAAETIVKLEEHYRDNPNVTFTIIDNTGKTAADAKITDLAFLHNYDYFNLEGRLRAALDAEFHADQPKISEAVYRGTLGQFGGADAARIPSRSSDLNGSGAGPDGGGGKEAGASGEQSGARQKSPGAIFRGAGSETTLNLRPEEADAAKLHAVANKVGAEWQEKLGPDIKVVMGGSLVSRTYVRAGGHEPIDMDIRFLTDNPERDYPKVEAVTGLKLRKTINVDDANDSSGSSKAFMVEGPLTRDGITYDVEAAVRSPAYVGWARFYPEVMTADELSAFRGDKAALKGDKAAYKALKSNMLAEVRRRVEARGGPNSISHPVEAVHAAFEEAAATGKPTQQYSPDAAQAPSGPLQPAGHFMFPAGDLNVDAKRFQFKSDGDAQGVNKALAGVTQWDTSKAGGVIVWQQKDGKLFIADGHQRSGLARRLMAQGHAPIELPGVLYREVDGVKAEDTRAIAASANIANGSGSALDGAKVLRSRPDLINGSLPLSTGKGKQAVALAKLNDEAFGMVVNEVVPENYGAVVGELIPHDGARQVAAIKAIARFGPRNVDEAAALVNRVKAAELAKTDKGAQGSMFGDLETAESTAGEEMKIVGRAIADLKKDKTLFARVVANVERIEQTGSKIEQETAKSVATDAEKFARILASDAYTAGPIRNVLVAAAKDLKNGHETIGDAAARVVSALRGETENAVADRNGAGGRVQSEAKGSGDGATKPAEPAPGTYHKPIEEAGTEPGADGKPQGLIPGVEPIKAATVKEQLIDAAARPMTGGDKPADGLFGNSMNEPELFDAKPRTIFEQAQDRARGQEILDGTEGGSASNLGAAASPPTSASPRGVLPAGRLVTALRDTASRVVNVWHDIQMNTVPMALGSNAARATGKDFGNALRRIGYELSRQDDAIVKAFPGREDRARMWSASDEESVARQLKEPLTPHMGLATLTADERGMVEQLQTRMQVTFVQARDIGMVEGEGLPSYTPRMLINIATGDGRGPRALNALGTNLTTTTARLKHRAHMMDFETEEAGKARFGDDVELARDIRSYPIAVAELERAIAGRQLINDIKEIGQRAGAETVAEGAKPADGPKWFTIDHPAFKTWRPKLQLETDGVYRAIHDDNGNVIFEQVPLYVHNDFEGPLRAVLGQKSGAFYQASMAVKGKTMSYIMNSPLIHNAVEFGRAFTTMPIRMMTLRVYRDGAKAIADLDTMKESINHGRVPIGHRGFGQDINSVMEAPELKAGRSTEAQVLAFVPGLFNPKAGLAVKEAIDRAGNFWHNTMLWDQVEKLSAGLYTNFRDDMIAKGIDPETAKYQAAHMANRYAGALPREAMSHNATAWANFLFFSRSFTMGNLGVMKDMFTGLPRDVLAQIERDTGSIDPKSLDYAKSLARRKAIAIVVADVVAFHVANSLLQSIVNVVSGRKDVSQEAQDYADRFKKEMDRVQNDPTAILHPFAIMDHLSSTAENEPGKQNRIYIGKSKDGTALYGRFPFGKIGEEFEGYFDSPLEMARKKEGTIFKPLMEVFNNDKGFDRKIYNPFAETYTDKTKALLAVGAHIAQAQVPSGQLGAIKDLATGQGDATTNAAQAFGPLLGLTVSKGAPGGPAVAELYRWQAEHKFLVDSKLPEWRKQIQAGDAMGAVSDMTHMGLPKGLVQYYVRTALHPEARLTARAIKDFYMGATPEQRSRMEDTLKRQSVQ